MLGEVNPLDDFNIIQSEFSSTKKSHDIKGEKLEKLLISQAVLRNARIITDNIPQQFIVSKLEKLVANVKKL